MAKKSLRIKTLAPKKYSTRKYHRCPICGRPRGYLRKFDMCRICFRMLARQGEIVGVIKSSW